MSPFFILDPMISFDFPEEQEILQPFLEKEEKILWIGLPKQGILFSWVDIFLIPFSILWGGFSFFWEWMALQGLMEGEEAFAFIFPIVGIPFVMVGLQLMIGRFFSDKRRRKNTIYALTNQRVLFKYKEELSYYKLEDLRDIRVSEKKDGSGSVFFVDTYSTQPIFENTTWPSRKKQLVSFDQIQGVQEVHEQILKAQKNIKG